MDNIEPRGDIFTFKHTRASVPAFGKAGSTGIYNNNVVIILLIEIGKIIAVRPAIMRQALS